MFLKPSFPPDLIYFTFYPLITYLVQRFLIYDTAQFYQLDSKEKYTLRMYLDELLLKSPFLLIFNLFQMSRNFSDLLNKADELNSSVRFESFKNLSKLDKSFNNTPLPVGSCLHISILNFHFRNPPLITSCLNSKTFSNPVRRFGRRSGSRRTKMLDRVY